MSDHKTRMVSTLRKKYEYEMQKAKTVFMNYLENPVALGEHPDLPKEADDALAQWEHSHSSMEALRELTSDWYNWEVKDNRG